MTSEPKCVCYKITKSNPLMHSDGNGELPHICDDDTIAVIFVIMDDSKYCLEDSDNTVIWKPVDREFWKYQRMWDGFHVGYFGKRKYVRCVSEELYKQVEQ